jgi:hypothetical protein
MGIPVQEYTPGKGQDKIARLNSVSDIIASGKVWVPKTRWAEELVDEVAAFPSGEHDDLVDATTLALMRFRQGGFFRLPIDEPEEIHWFKRNKQGKKYFLLKDDSGKVHFWLQQNLLELYREHRKENPIHNG